MVSTFSKNIVFVIKADCRTSTEINPKLYGCIDLRVIYQSARRIKSFFPYKDIINRSQVSKVVYKASCWDCQDFYIGKTKRRLHDRKTEHFKGITSTCHASAIADHVTSTGHNLKHDGTTLRY